MGIARRKTSDSVHSVDKSFADLTERRPERRWPRLPCPVCRTGRLQFSSSSHILDTNSEDVLRAYHANLDGPDELSGHFTGTLTCGDESCDGKTVMAGEYSLSYSEEKDTDWTSGSPRPEFTAYFLVRFLAPAPVLIEVPQATPAVIHESILEAGRVFWASPASAANLFRQAVERVLDEEGVPSKTAKGGFLPTQKRIDEYAKTNPDLADLLEATKWIGNDGSHDLQLTAKEVLTGAEYLERVLGDLYGTPALLARAKALNSTKRPAKARTSSVSAT